MFTPSFCLRKEKPTFPTAAVPSPQGRPVAASTPSPVKALTGLRERVSSLDATGPPTGFSLKSMATFLSASLHGTLEFLYWRNYHHQHLQNILLDEDIDFTSFLNMIILVNMVLLVHLALDHSCNFKDTLYKISFSRMKRVLTAPLGVLLEGFPAGAPWAAAWIRDGPVQPGPAARPGPPVLVHALGGRENQRK